MSHRLRIHRRRASSSDYVLYSRTITVKGSLLLFRHSSAVNLHRPIHLRSTSITLLTLDFILELAQQATIYANRPQRVRSTGRLLRSSPGSNKPTKHLMRPGAPANDGVNRAQVEGPSLINTIMATIVRAAMPALVPGGGVALPARRASFLRRTGEVRFQDFSHSRISTHTFACRVGRGVLVIPRGENTTSDRHVHTPPFASLPHAAGAVNVSSRPMALSAPAVSSPRIPRSDVCFGGRPQLATQVRRPGLKRCALTSSPL